MQNLDRCPHRGCRKRFVVRADEELTAFVEVEVQVSSFTRLPIPAHREVGPKSYRLPKGFNLRNLPDLNQAEDLSPLGSSSLPDPQLHRTQRGKERDEA